jgi:hypothetical protein
MVTRSPADRGTKVTTRVSVGLFCGCMNVRSNKIMSIVPHGKFVKTSTNFQKKLNYDIGIE